MTITIIHFNDCYNIEPSAQSSGAAGFLTAINQHRHLNPMILFSGDIISPSFMSTFTKGEQMIPVLNDIGVDCAVFGNHEFDYGVDNLIDFVKKTTFPWLLSNVIDKETSNQLGDGKLFHIIERDGLKFGLIGLIEEEWLSTLSTLDSSDVIYEDFVTKGQELAKQLKAEPYNVDYVIALTHSRTPNDIRLADSVPEIDLILGGHDHDYEIIKRPNCYIIKSGTDFREFSKITINANSNYLDAKKKGLREPKLKAILEPINIERVECLNYEPDAELKKKLDKFSTTIDEKMDKVLGQFNYIMLASTHADVAILNSGTLRSDRIHPKGDFTMRDLFNILGYIDPIAVLLSSGYEIWQALENGVSQWPKLEGRFPQISGCIFTFDPKKPPMNRIDPKDIIIGDELLILDKQYRLTTKAYLASGKDGYDILKKCKVLVPGDESPDLTTSILNHFEAINIIKSNRRTHHRQSIICLSRNSLKKILDNNSQDVPSLASTPTIANHNHLNSPMLSSQAGSFDMASIKESPLLEDTTLNVKENNLPNDDNNNNNNNQRVNETTFGQDESEVVSHISNGFNGSGHPKTPNSVFTPLAMPVGVSLSGEPEVGLLSPSIITTPSSTAQIKPRSKRLMSLYEIEQEQCQLEPRIEGRIRIVGVNC